jgi:hypothetical protein
MAVVNLTTTGLEAQVIVFIAVTLARFLLFASFFSYVPATFGFGTFGTVLGLISVAAAVFGLLQGVLTSLTMETLNADYDPVNIAWIIASVGLVAYPAWLWSIHRLRGSARLTPKPGTIEAVPPQLKL